MNNREVIKSVARKIREKVFPSRLSYLKKELQNCNSILDLGCGNNSPIQHLYIPYSVGVDIYEATIDESKRKKIHDNYIKADIRKIEFKEKSFDASVAFAVLEHLTKEEGLRLIEKMDKCAKKKIIIAVPNGYQHQDAYDGNPYQIHKSGWSAKEFEELGFKVCGMHGWKVLRGELGQIRFKPTLFWLFISDITQKLTYHWPNLASTLFAVKEVPKESADYRNLRKILFIKVAFIPILSSIDRSIAMSSRSKLLVNKIAKPYIP